MKPVICLDPLYPGISIADKVARVAAAGFAYVEFWGWRDKNVPELITACRQHNVKVVNFNGHRVGSFVATRTHDELFAEIRDTVTIAQQLECPTLGLMTNSLSDDGNARDSFDDIPLEQKYRNTVLALRKILEITPPEITWALEPLNTVLDHPGYYLTDMTTAVALIREVNNPRVKVLCDLYHLGMMGADLPRIIDDYLAEVGHFHIADIPGRHEPGTGAVDWLAILRQIQRAGYIGYIGFEYFPKNNSDESLAAIRQLWNLL